MLKYCLSIIFDSGGILLVFDLGSSISDPTDLLDSEHGWMYCI